MSTLTGEALPLLATVEMGTLLFRFRSSVRVFHLTFHEFKKSMNKRNLFVCYGFLFGILGSSTAFASQSGGDVGACTAFPSELVIDHVWAGVRDKFDSIENKDFIYAAYYDADRWLTVAQINKCTGEQKKVRIPSHFAGWDSHNYITLALDRTNRLHVSGNMHASSLVYARMDAPDQLAGLAKLQPMVGGAGETQTTYPIFFRFTDGALGFSYRSGHSGNGVELINRLDGNHWTRLTNRPVFAPDPGGKAVNAYPTNFVLGPDGDFHVAWVWRESPNVETNFNVNYAKSKDLRVWQNSSGQVLTLPITPSSAEVVDAVPKGDGLFNNIRLGFDATGRPIISYLKFDASGATQLFHARSEATGWKSTPATAWTYRWAPQGRGTIPSVINFSGVQIRNGQLVEEVHQPEIGEKTFLYDDLLKIRQVLGADVWDSVPRVSQGRGPQGMVLNGQVVGSGKVIPGKTHRSYAISWFSLTADNRDKPRACEASGSCNYSSELVLHTMPTSSGKGE